MTLQAHLKELRTRLFVLVVAFVIFATAAYMVHDTLLTALLAPLEGQKLAYLNPGGGFSFVFAVTAWSGLALTMPLLVYNLYSFLAPALPARARTRGGLIFASSCVLFAAGAAFGYMYAIPAALKFLIGFGDGYVQAMLTADAYLNFVLLYTIGLGLLFQLPIIMMVIHWITPLKPGKLLAFERYVVAGAFVAAAFMTPTPDIVNQSIVAAPFIGMYQVGLVGVTWSHWRQKRAARRQGVVLPIPAPAMAAVSTVTTSESRPVAAPATPSASLAPRPTMHDVRRSHDRVQVPPRQGNTRPSARPSRTISDII